MADRAPIPKQGEITAPAFEAPTPTHNPEMHLPEDFGAGRTGKLLFWIAVAFAAFQIVTAFGIPINRPLALGLTLTHLAGAGLALWAAFIGYGAARGRPVIDGLIGLVPVLVSFILLARFGGGMPSQVLRGVHVGFLGLLAGGMLAHHRAFSPGAKALWWLAGGLAFIAGLYHWHLYRELVVRAGDLTTPDIVIGVAAVVTLFLLVWRVLGPALPIVAGTFLAYALLGHLLPSPLNHRGYDFEQVVEQMGFGTEGIYGTPTAVSATYIFLFILFGSFMEQAGVIRFFNEISIGLFGGTRGGPGKVCVASSALMGTVSGSGVANVVASGQFTIPLMKRFGFPGAFAGGVEATSSMGGQIMPPVMGAVAFIMAETIGVPYAEIVKAAIIPALLYFGACFWSVHLEAGKRGLHGLPRNELPSVMSELRQNGFLILPLLALVYLLFSGFTPLFAGAVGLALTVVMIVGTAVSLGVGNAALRVVFWVGLALLCAWSIWTSVALVLLVVAVLVAAALFSGRGRQTLEGCRAALADGARQALPVGLACALVGVVIGVMTLTGLGTIIGTSLIAIGRDSMFAALVLTMIFSLILGMGIPTIPNYIITSSLAAPILLQLGVPLIVSHMFVFYFGIMADLTPPVALAAFAAAPMAKESGMKIGVQAVRIALPGFIIPYMAVYDPNLMLQPVPGLEGASYWMAVAYIVVKASLAMLLWGAAAFGHVQVRLVWWERVLAAVAAAFLVAAVPLTDQIGFVLAAIAVAAHVYRARVAATRQPA
jgi:TRAP transporter 4TM/12TM fusion protein